MAGEGEQTVSECVFLDAKVLPAGHSAGSEQAPFDPPQLPLCHWNEAYMHLDSRTWTLNFTNTARTSQLETMNHWPPREIDYLEFVNVETLQQGRMQVVTHPDFDASILIKIASSSSEIPSLEREIAVHRLLRGSGVVPQFLGLVTEGGRVIGFITEYIREVPSIRGRSMQSCLVALHSLHQRGIAHGDAHDGNCLIRQDGSAALIDFELSVETWLPEEFERDLDIMSRCIQAYISETP